MLLVLGASTQQPMALGAGDNGDNIPWSMLLTLPEKNPGQPKSLTVPAEAWEFPLPTQAVVSHFYSTRDQTP